jgi:hypothetical protein
VLLGVVGGREVVDFLEGLAEVFGILDTHFEGNFGDAHGGLGQQLGGALKAHVADKLHRRLATDALDAAVKNRLAHGHFLHQDLHTEIGVTEVLFDHAHCLLQELAVGVGHYYLGGLEQDVALVKLMQLAAVAQQAVGLGVEQGRVEGLAHVLISAHAYALQLVGFGGAGGEQQHRNVGRFGVLLDTLAQFQAVAVRHHHVGDDKVGELGQGLCPAHQAIFGGEYLVVGLKNLAQVLAHLVVVLDHQHALYHQVEPV